MAVLTFPHPRRIPLLLIALALLAFSLAFMMLDQAYYQFTNARFPNVGESTWLATLWGVVSRAHLLLVLIPLVLIRPRQLGFQFGKIHQHWRMLLVMLLANCGVIALYLWLTSTSTPYSANQWLFTEAVTVPVIEEVFWRGLVMGVVLSALRTTQTESASLHLAAWFCGVAFGLLHANNLFAGLPAIFVAVQVLNATIWGVVYGYARLKTESIYPPIFLHAAMNLIVVLF